VPEVPLVVVLVVPEPELLAEFLAFAWYWAKVLVAVGFIANTIPAWQWLAGFV
jgi:hypothetical protein